MLSGFPIFKFTTLHLIYLKISKFFSRAVVFMILQVIKMIHACTEPLHTKYGFSFSPLHRYSLPFCTQLLQAVIRQLLFEDAKIKLWKKTPQKKDDQ